MCVSHFSVCDMSEYHIPSYVILSYSCICLSVQRYTTTLILFCIEEHSSTWLMHLNVACRVPSLGLNLDLRRRLDYPALGISKRSCTLHMVDLQRRQNGGDKHESHGKFLPNLLGIDSHCHNLPVTQCVGA
jgi:hypothetical protein